jgi:hypothetical protein
MAYNITLTDGSLFATIADGTVNTSSSMTLIGKNYAGYGDFLDENFIRLLENGSNTTAPSSPLVGQLWWDRTNGLLKVYNGTIFKTISAATASASAPTSNVTGDLWYDTSNQQLKAWTGSAFIVIGPAYTQSQGTSGAIPETIDDSGGSPKLITSLYVNNNRVGTIYDAASFTPQASLVAAFPTIFPGITLNTTISNAQFAGTAQNTVLFDGQPVGNFVSATAASTSITGNLTIRNNNGFFIGNPANVFSVTTSATDANVLSVISGGNLVLQANVSGTRQPVATALGSNGTFAISNAATVGTSLTVTGNAVGGNLNTTGQVSASGNITGGNVTGALITGTAPGGVSISAVGNVQAGNLRTSGAVSATGNITAAGNISGSFLFGNGSQLTGLSGAININEVVNGTTTFAIPVSSGNANITVGAVSNVVVFTTTNQIFGTQITVPAIAKSGPNAAGNIGSSSNYFDRVFATSTSALYADVAERFAADEVLEAGTVVELGGQHEITRSVAELSDSVFGVISTKAAYLMNDGVGDDLTHPPVAMTGRVPVRTIGSVRKGDRLVSAGNGLARAALPGEATAFNVIGRALANKDCADEGLVEAIVSIK